MEYPQKILEELGSHLPLVLVGDDNRIVLASPPALAIFSLEEKELAGHLFDEIFAPTTVDGRNLRTVALSTPQSPAALPSRDDRELQDTLHPDQLMYVDAVPINNADAIPRAYLLIDQTALVRTRGECVHLSQLAAAGRLISSIVHEINNPLSGIIGYSQLLLMREIDRESRAAVEKIYGEALRTSRIVRNLLDFARRRSATSTHVNLADTIRKALELKSHDLKVHNVKVHLDVPEAMPDVHGDPHQLMQVFVNLISNSEQAMYGAERGGRLSIIAEASGTSVSVLIKDTGPGIPEELRPRVFEPFFTTKVEGEGTGLGLALCREMLERQKAHIELAGGSDGTQFEITFVPAKEAAEIPAATSDQKQTPRIRGQHAVVVEDDPVCRALITEALEQAGNDVTSFDRSDAAIQYLKAHAADVIISDLHRPGLNGIEFHEELLRFDSNLARRVLFLTGDMLNDELTTFLKRHGNRYLAKPIQIPQLFESIHEVLSAAEGQQKSLFSGDLKPADLEQG